MKKFKQQIDELTLMPSDGGRFEIKVDGEELLIMREDDIIAIVE